MHRRFGRFFSFLRTTVIGGVVFLLPLAAVGWLLGQAAQIAWSVVAAVQQYLAAHEGTPSAPTPTSARGPTCCCSRRRSC